MLVGDVTYVPVQKSNGWTVAQVAPDSGKPAGVVTMVGVLPHLANGAHVEALGEWTVHPKYGKQFKASSVHTEHPSDTYSLEAYLESVVEGVGPTLAFRIVDTFGDGTVAAMTDPEKLKTVEGIGDEKAVSISEAWTRHEADRAALEETMGWLAKNDLNPDLAHKLVEEFGLNCRIEIEQNPYRLTKIHGIGFLKADAIALKLGFEKDDPIRLRAGLRFVVGKSRDTGHCYVNRDALLIAAKSDLFYLIPKEELDHQLDLLIALPGDQNPLVEEDGRIYLPSIHDAEAGTAHHLARLLVAQEKPVFDKLSKRSNEQLLADLQVDPERPYTEEQEQAVVQALRSPVSIITGGPGTGKSTILNGLLDIADRQGLSYTLASPTGKAAKRMNEVTGRPAATIHRTLGYNPEFGFTYNAQEPLGGDLFIIDEVSMLDIWLANKVIQAIPDGGHLVLVGDVDQLPSVGPGAVLNDLIESGCIPTVRLTTIFRTAEGSKIALAAQAIKEGRMPEFDKNVPGEIFFFKAETAEEVRDWVIDLVESRIPQALGYRSDDIQVLSPQKKTEAGTIRLNERLQAILNPPSPNRPEVKRGKHTFRLGDRVIQMVNNYDLEVFNGETGRIASISEDEKGTPSLTASYDMDIRTYSKEDMGDLKLAYALTVHKSQGSEFPVIVVPVTTSHYIMLQRNLLYTAVSRAQKCVVLVGTKRALHIAINNDKALKRNTTLQERLTIAIQTANEIKAIEQEEELF
jgi:exodeoxyribonuclease V alpha subunit